MIFSLFSLLFPYIPIFALGQTGKIAHGQQRDLNVFSNLDEILSFFRNDSSHKLARRLLYIGKDDLQIKRLNLSLDMQLRKSRLQNLEQQHPLAGQIVDTFVEKCFFPDTVREPGAVLKPVIVIEGNHKSSRDVVVAGLAQMLNARVVTHPAPCIHRFHPMLPRGSALRRAFYLLSNYAASSFAKSRMDRPIIINGYWTEQMAFTLTHNYEMGCLPPVTDHVFDFPPDMLQPDVIFYINFPDKMVYSHVTTKSPLTWKPRMLECYSHMSQRYPIVMKDLKPLFKITTEEIHLYIHQHLYDKVFGVRNLTGTVPAI